MTFLGAHLGIGHSATAGIPRAYADALKSELATYARTGLTRQLTALLQLGQQYIKDQTALPEFRAAIGVDVASNIALAAASSDRGLRIAAALLLVDLVDNRTMCAVANVLLQDEIDVDARYNFLQILRIANRYAMAENRVWNARAIEAANQFVESGGENASFSKTSALIATFEDEQETFASPANLLTLSREQPESLRACLGLSNIARMTAENAAYVVFLHTQRPRNESDAVKAGLEGLGFVVKGVDNKVDTAGGTGIDYASAPNEPSEGRERTRAKADMIAEAIAATLGAKLSPRAQSQVPRGAFGIWL